MCTLLWQGPWPDTPWVGLYCTNHGGPAIPLETVSSAAMYIKDTFPAEHLRSFSETVLSHETVGYFFSHAGEETGLRIEEQGRYSEHLLLWGNDDFINDDSYYGTTVVYGHYHIDRPLIRPNKICISLSGAIATFDIDNGVIVDSRGDRTEV